MSIDAPAPAPRRRFKRRYVVGLRVIGLSIGLAAVWSNRPLTKTERYLIGSWQSESTETVLTYRVDRTATLIESLSDPKEIDRLKWRSVGDRLHTASDNFGPKGLVAVSLFLQRAMHFEFSPPSVPLVIVDNDTFECVGDTWRRIPTR
jgi:hypothetical protein